MDKTAKRTTNRLKPFVPRLALDLAQGTAGTDTHQLVDGSMLSADISGFTALSERLARKGREGAEELTALINACFTGLIDAAAASSGEVIKFGGDALLVMFRGENHQRRAARAAQTMQVVLVSLGAARRANLSMTVGVAEGPFSVFLVGSTNRELLVCGPKATEVIRLEASAGSGQVLASPAIASALAELQLEGGRVIWEPAQPVDEPSLPVDDLTPYVPHAVVEQLSAFTDTGGEHRQVTVGFVSLSGVAASLERHGPDATAHELGTVVDLINASCADFAVTALHSDIAPDGVKFVLCAGAPLSAGNSSDALLQSALRISGSTSPFVLKQGVQRGRVFAGFLGSRSRRNYTLMGDAVNTAARMLGRADDREIVAVADVVRDTRSIFIAEELEPFLVKGKKEPISAFKVLEITNEVRRSGEYADLVGRESELQVINDAVEERGRFVHLVGAGGSGKSRLIDQVRYAVDSMGFGRFQSTCSPYGSSSPYALFRGLLRSGFGMDIHTDAETAGDMLEKVVRNYARDLVPWVPLLAIPFGAKVASTPEVDALGAEFRRERMHEVVADFLDMAFDLPVAMIAEDVHWADDASVELLDHLARETVKRGWLLFSTQRPTADFAFGTEVDQATIIEVADLSDDAVRALAIDVSATPITDQELKVIVARASGNPLFAIELARAVESGGVDQLPDSVEKLVSSRLDELSPDGRRLLRIASIFGMEMKESALAASLAVEAPDLVPPWEEVDEFLTRGSEGVVTFANIVTHDAAYEGLPFRARRRLHNLVGELIESATDHPERIAGLLTIHFSEAKQHPKAWRYGVIAGDDAAQAGANVEAVGSYQLAVDSARYVPGLESHEISRVAAELADAQHTLGQFDESRKSLQYARKHNDSLAIEVDLMRRLGSTEEREGNYPDALRWWTRADAKLPVETTDPELIRQRAQLELARAGIFHRRDEHELVLESATKALAAADAIDDKPSIALAAERMHLALMLPPNPDSAAHGKRAAAMYEELGDHVGWARSVNNLGVDAYYSGRWTAASEMYGESMRIGLIAGSAIDGPMGGLNKGEILSDQGHWTEAVVLLEDVLRNWTAKGYTIGIGVGQLYLGNTFRRMGQGSAAAEMLNASIERLDTAGLAAFVADARSRRLELDVFQGRVKRAEIDAFMGGLSKDSGLRPRMLRTSALAHSLAGQTERARNDMMHAVDATTGYERAVGLRGLVHLDPESASAKQWTTEADHIFADLEVVRIADFPS